ncbi:hypothetical protein [Methylobacterium longum]|jgi:hypothetical protein|uniref:Phospholipase A2 domain-containing protein n=1 Tax=Methylobacterium longum TaxID=767694 RepID=A0ABT8AXY1_9HYPH|nr:hypothetical protein [Methylobacterium longum]MDN3574295.1 hypothetical protein [Methylobacterium longum]GJE13374.1 hypothetical protein FOHLNKBM_4437 [Methylobacterium longum]
MSPRTAIGLAAPLLLVTAWAAPSLAQPAANGGPTLLIHGNYCGPGNNAPLPPIDALDAACARHDACTPDVGLPSKACNLRLEREAAAVARDPRQPDDVRSLAGFVASFAASNASRAAPSMMPARYGP